MRPDIDGNRRQQAPAGSRGFRLALCLLLFGASGYAGTASPNVHVLRQPDGSAFQARQWGDECLHGWETVDGYTVIRDTQSGVWYYAETDAEGRLQASAWRVGAAQPLGLPRQLRPWAAAPDMIRSGPVARRGQRRAGPAGERGQAAASEPAFATVSAGRMNVAVLLISFPDRKPTQTPADFEDLLFGDHPTIATGPGSMKDYYQEVSYGKLVLSSGPSGVSGWYTAAHIHDYYGDQNGYGPSEELATEAIKAAAAAGFDFSRYDADGDGVVDAIMVVHQGDMAEDTGNETNIWSHESWLDLKVGAMKTGSYVLVPESQASRAIAGIGVFAHEFGHMLGLPDLYGGG